MSSDDQETTEDGCSELDPPSPASPERQMARLAVFAKLKTAVEEKVEHYRDFSRDDLTNGQFAAQILMGIYESGVAFYLDEVDQVNSD